MTLPLPVSIALVGDLLILEFPDGHTLRLPDEPRGWKQLRDICVARQLAAGVASIATPAKPIQYQADTKHITKVFSADAAIAARARLKELGLK